MVVLLGKCSSLLEVASLASCLPGGTEFHTFPAHTLLYIWHGELYCVYVYVLSLLHTYTHIFIYGTLIQTHIAYYWTSGNVHWHTIDLVCTMHVLNEVVIASMCLCGQN